VTVFVWGAWLALVPWWLTAAVVARDVMIGLGALTYRLWFGPLCGRPTVISKINTAAQLFYLMLVLLHAACGLPPHELLDALALLTCAATLLSGVHYTLVFTRRAWLLPTRTA
jgi:cardiolipin synthase